MKAAIAVALHPLSLRVLLAPISGLSVWSYAIVTVNGFVPRYNVANHRFKPFAWTFPANVSPMTTHWLSATKNKEIIQPADGSGASVKIARKKAQNVLNTTATATTNESGTEEKPKQLRQKSLALTHHGDQMSPPTATLKLIPVAPTKRLKNTKKADLYWRVEGDPWRIERSVNRTTLIFKIRGNPLPLRRHRTSRGFMYNPSAAAQAEFYKLVQELIWSESDAISAPPLFGIEEQLSLSVVFSMKRPLNHFTASKRQEGRLKATATDRVGSIRTDVDNLAKFIMDSLNGMVYADDKQVASIHATKCYDSEGLCEGSTLVCIRNLQESDLEGLLDIKL